MELTVKRIALNIICASAVAITLAGSYVTAEPAPGSEKMTVEVTRTSEGVVVVTPHGRRVLLKDDHTWEEIEVVQEDPLTSAVMMVANISGLRNACKVGLRLENNLGYNIKSLIPSFTAYTPDGVAFETVSKAFSSIKPTRDQYRQIQFIGITCDDIGHVRVHGGSRCSMGSMDKFNEEAGECLSHVYVQPSDLIKITK